MQFTNFHSSGIRKITLDKKRNKPDKERQGDKATCQTGFKMTKKVWKKKKTYLIELQMA